MRPTKRLTTVTIALCVLFGPAVNALAETNVTTSNESRNTSVKSGDSTVSNNNNYTTGHASADDSDVSIADSSSGDGVASFQDGSNSTSATGVESVVSGDVVTGETVGSVPASAAANSADLVLTEPGPDAGVESNPVEALFVGLPVSGGSPLTA